MNWIKWKYRANSSTPSHWVTSARGWSLRATGRKQDWPLILNFPIFCAVVFHKCRGTIVHYEYFPFVSFCSHPTKPSGLETKTTMIALSLAYFYLFLWMLCKDGQNSEGDRPSDRSPHFHISSVHHRYKNHQRVRAPAPLFWTTPFTRYATIR